MRGYVEQFPNAEAAVASARGKCIGAIGPIAAAAARTLGFHVDFVADVATTDALLDAFEAHPDADG